MNYHGQSIATGGGSIDPLDKILVERYGLDKYVGTAIECGANDGIYLSNCLVLEELGWKVINIEASWPNYVKLIRNRQTSTNIYHALSDKDYETVEINNYTDDNGGADKISYVSTEYSKRFKNISNSVVSTITYKTLIMSPIDLFVLDVEGHELQVINGMKDTYFWPKIFCIEYPHVGLDNLNALLLQRYKLDYYDSLNAIYIL